MYFVAMVRAGGRARSGEVGGGGGASGSRGVFGERAVLLLVELWRTLGGVQQESVRRRSSACGRAKAARCGWAGWGACSLCRLHAEADAGGGIPIVESRAAGEPRLCGIDTPEWDQYRPDCHGRHVHEHRVSCATNIVLAAVRPST
jgi:hypothetical protein